MSFNLSEQGRTHLGHVGDGNQGHDAGHTWNGEQDLGTIPGKGLHVTLPAENGLKWSLYLNFPFSFRKCSGLNFSGSGNSWLSYKRESSVGIMTVPWKEQRLPWSVKLTQHRLTWEPAVECYVRQDGMFPTGEGVRLRADREQVGVTTKWQ